jgi:hypothetical protein
MEDRSPSIKTDHWLVSAKITTPEAPLIGNGRWQIPSYLFEREEAMKEINEPGKIALDDINTTRVHRLHTCNPQYIFTKFKRTL